MRTIKIVACVAVISALTSCKFLREKGILGGGDGKTKEYIDSLEKIVKVDSAKYTAQMAQIKKTSKEKIDSLEKSCGGALGHYYVIAGSFLNPLNAESYNNQMSKLGYKSQIIDALNGFKMVSVYNGDSYSDVVSQLNAMRTTVSADAWVFVK
jgi:hypothetical protein